ncbi:MAG: replication initiator protein A, partial [Pseudomonadota bacterium]
DYLVATGKPIGGSGYARAEDALERLKGTTIKTNIATGGEREWNIFGIVESAKTIRRGAGGKLQEVQVTLSDWVFNAIEAREVLTISRQYFRLRKPLERRLYEILRKHCGKSSTWKISLEVLKEKCGSQSTMKEFRRMIGKIVEDDAIHGHMPDYSIALEDDFVICYARGTVPIPKEEVYEGQLSYSIYEEARAAAPGWDVRAIEQEWRRWCGAEEIIPKSPDRHFVKFCASWFERRGRPG